MKYLKEFLGIWKDFQKNNGLLWATTLTYTTLFALVPLFAVALSIFKVFGGFDEIQKTLLPMISEILDPTHKIKIVLYLQGFFDKIHAGTMGIVGTVFFILTFIPLFLGMENAINTIWGKEDDRPLWLKFVLYWAVTTLGPVAMVVIFTMLSFFNELLPTFGRLHSLKPMMLLFIVFGMFLIYKIVPNTEVRNKPALTGAIISGILWIIANGFYQMYMKYATASFTIYGSLGAIPVFLLWIYINWIILLFGVQIARYMQYPLLRYYSSQLTPTDYLKISLKVLKLLYTKKGLSIYLNENQICQDIELPPNIISEVINKLKSLNFIIIKGGLILPNKTQQEIPLADLIEIYMGNIEDIIFQELSIDPSRLHELKLADIE